VVTAENRNEYGKLLDELAVLRHNIFVETLGWTLPMAANGRELDQYDNDEAMYAIVTSQSGAIRAAVRLHQTTRPTLLTEVFPNLIGGEFSGAPEVWEGTRMLVAPSLGRDGRNALRELCMAVGIVGFSQGISRYVSVSDPFMERVLRQVGAAPRRLGPVLEVEPGIYALALEMDCSHACYNRVSVGIAPLMVMDADERIAA
jgi:acyl-homoserine lactone synthase